MAYGTKIGEKKVIQDVCALTEWVVSQEAASGPPTTDCPNSIMSFAERAHVDLIGRMCDSCNNTHKQRQHFKLDVFINFLIIVGLSVKNRT